MDTNSQATYRKRRLDPVIDRLLDEMPAVLLLGPRAAGKTTLAAQRAASVLQLDRPAEADAVRGDPDAVLRGLPEPVLVDEWQFVPEILGAVKRACDAEPRPGRFLLTGSVRAELDSPLWPGTGRVVVKRLYGFAQAERQADWAAPFVDRCFTGGLEAPHPSSLDLRDYVDLALQSGFPPVLDVGLPVRRDWMASYLEQLVARDMVVLRPRADRELLTRFVEVAALHTSTVLDLTSLADDAGIARRTAEVYAELLRGVHLTASLPAWHSNRLKRLTRRPKHHLVEPALLAPAARLDTTAVLRDANLLGRLLESFVVAQLRAELEWVEVPARLHHLRLEKGEREIDVVVEARGEVVAIEVKSGSRVDAADTRHLAWLRDQLGERFRLGIVLHTGPYPVELGDRILAAPIATLWS